MSGVGELLLGIALGLTLAPPPGPMNVWIAAAAVRSYRAGVATGLGAVAADGVLGVAVFGLVHVVDLSAVLRVVYVLGAAVLALFGYRLLRATRKPAAPPAQLRSFAQALGLGLSNPYQILWWLTAGLGFAYSGGPWLLAGLFAALLGWVAGFPWLVRTGARRWPRLEGLVRVGSSVALFAFAAYFAVLAVLAPA